MKLLFSIGAFLTLIMIFGCSSSEESTKRSTENYKEVKKFRNEVKLNIDKNISWVNLMPGSQPKFHVTGKLSLLVDDNYNYQNTELKYIKIYQSGEELYFIMPKVIQDISDSVKNFTYSTIKGLSINKNLDTKKPVIFELIFLEGKEELKYRINNVIVEEVM